MSADGSVDLVFGGDLRKFRLGIAELIALQERRNSGPYELLFRVASGAWRVGDILDTVRIALIGAGMDGKAATQITEENLRPGKQAAYGEKRLGELEIGVEVAKLVLTAAITGVPDDPVGKVDAAAGAKAKNSPRRTSTRRAQR
jgi:hypothetical protein